MSKVTCFCEFVSALSADLSRFVPPHQGLTILSLKASSHPFLYSGEEEEGKLVQSVY